MDATTLIARHQLKPHPEGGYYRETWRAEQLLPGTNRSVGTAILYLLPEGQCSRLHRLDADELWHFHAGGGLQVVELTAGEPLVTVLSPEHPQHVVRAGTWFGSTPLTGAGYSFVGCTVSPGFEFAHFELGQRASLLEAFPQARTWVERLT